MTLEPDKIQGYLAGNRDPKVEEHLVECDECRNRLVSQYIQHNRPIQTPKDLIDKTVESILKLQENPAEILIKWVKDTLSAFSDTWILAEPVLVRGKNENETLILTRHIGKLSAKILLEKASNQLCDITIILKGKNSKSIENIRVVFSQDGKDRESYYLREGKVAFSKVAIGRYHIIIWKEAKMLASIGMNLD